MKKALGRGRISAVARSKWAVILIILGSCWRADTLETQLQNPCYDDNIRKELGFEVEAINPKISVPYHCNPTFSHVQVWHERWLYGTRDGTNKIEVFDLANKTHIRTIQIDKNLTSNLGSFWVHQPDSIFVAQDPSHLLLVNSAGTILQKWALSTEVLGWNLPGHYQKVPVAFFFTNTQVIDGYHAQRGDVFVHFANPDVTVFSDDNKQKAMLCGVFNLKANRWTCTYGNLPKVYHTSQTQKYPFVLTIPEVCVVGDTSLVAFPMSHIVQIYHNKTGKLLGETCMASDTLSNYLMLSMPAFRLLMRKNSYCKTHFTEAYSIMPKRGYFHARLFGKKTPLMMILRGRLPQIKRAV